MMKGDTVVFHRCRPFCLNFILLLNIFSSTILFQQINKIYFISIIEILKPLIKQARFINVKGEYYMNLIETKNAPAAGDTVTLIRLCWSPCNLPCFKSCSRAI